MLRKFFDWTESLSAPAYIFVMGSITVAAGFMLVGVVNLFGE